jgi:hypothetical protein
MDREPKKIRDQDVGELRPIDIVIALVSIWLKTNRPEFHPYLLEAQMYDTIRKDGSFNVVLAVKASMTYTWFGFEGDVNTETINLIEEHE